MASGAAQLALQERPVADTRAERALERLRAGVPPEDPRPLAALIDELDDASAAFQLAWDEAREKGAGDAAELERRHAWTFEQARACAALRAALADHHDEASVGDALYEAAGAIGYRPDVIAVLVDAVLAGDADPVGRARRELGHH